MTGLSTTHHDEYHLYKLTLFLPIFPSTKRMMSLLWSTPSGLQPFSICNQSNNKNRFLSPCFQFIQTIKQPISIHVIKGQATTSTIPHDNEGQNKPEVTSLFKEYMSHKSRTVDQALGVIFSKMEPSKLVDSMRYSVSGGGKRIRPVLCIAAFELFYTGHESLSSSIIMPCACAVELIHTFTLIHDDLPCMDNSNLRRWKPSSHKAFGENIAVLTCDSLIPLAFEHITTSSMVSADKVLRAIQELARYSGAKALIAGQVADLMSSSSGFSDFGLDYLEFVHVNKTSSLLEAAVVMGAILGGANDEQVSKLRRYARCVGWSASIVDDILDVIKSSEELGKPAGIDLENEKMSYPRIIGIEKSKEFAEKLRNEALQQLAEFDDNKTLPLIGIANYCTSRDWARTQEQEL